jgi:hypothetical protein
MICWFDENAKNASPARRCEAEVRRSSISLTRIGAAIFVPLAALSQACGSPSGPAGSSTVSDTASPRGAGMASSAETVVSSPKLAPVFVKHELPSGIFRAVSMASSGGCALRESGVVVCWGKREACNDGRNGATIPTGRFVSLAGGPHAGCALDAAGNASCWGCAAAPNSARGKSARLRYIAKADEDRFCGIGIDGTVAGCKGFVQTTVQLETEPPRGAVLAVDERWYDDAGIGAADACAILADGGLDCWGLASQWRDETRRKKGPYTAVSVGPCRNNICVAKGDTVECPGDASVRQMPGRVTKLVSGSAHRCALAGGEVSCFSDKSAAANAASFSGPARDVAAYEWATCVVDERGSLACKGGGYTEPGPSYDVECGG